jgi:hypothetical protein
MRLVELFEKHSRSCAAGEFMGRAGPRRYPKLNLTSEGFRLIETFDCSSDIINLIVPGTLFTLIRLFN